MSTLSVIISSERTGKKLSYDGHMYVSPVLSADKMLEFWRCQFRNTCKAGLHRFVATKKVKCVSGMSTKISVVNTDIEEE